MEEEFVGKAVTKATEAATAAATAAVTTIAKDLISQIPAAGGRGAEEHGARGGKGHGGKSAKAIKSSKAADKDDRFGRMTSEGSGAASSRASVHSDAGDFDLGLSEHDVMPDSDDDEVHTTNKPVSARLEGTNNTSYDV